MIVRIQEKLIDYTKELDALNVVAGTGAVVQFTGLMRGQNDSDKGKDNDKDTAILKMEIECYRPMAQQHLERIVRAAQKKWPLDDAMVIHRIGSLLPGDVIVWVAAASAHRQAAFAACGDIMDYLKTDVPMWKREITATGSTWVAPPSCLRARGYGGRSGET